MKNALIKTLFTLSSLFEKWGKKVEGTAVEDGITGRVFVSYEAGPKNGADFFRCLDSELSALRIDMYDEWNKQRSNI
jgi:hypothetical protein